MMQKANTKYKQTEIYKFVNDTSNECFTGGTWEDLTNKFNNYKRLFNEWLMTTDSQNSLNGYDLFRLRITCIVVLYDNVVKHMG